MELMEGMRGMEARKDPSVLAETVALQRSLSRIRGGERVSERAVDKAARSLVKEIEALRRVGEKRAQQRARACVDGVYIEQRIEDFIADSTHSSNFEDKLRAAPHVASDAAHRTKLQHGNDRAAL